MANSSETDSVVRADPRQGWSDAWHLWRVLMPRRSIAGRLVWGMVWRRNRGGRWVYKEFVEYSDDRDQKPLSWIEAQGPAGELDNHLPRGRPPLEGGIVPRRSDDGRHQY